MTQGARSLDGEAEWRMDVCADSTGVGAQLRSHVPQRPPPTNALLSLLPALLLKTSPPSAHSWSTLHTQELT